MRRGFTLVEVVVVVAILAIAAGVVAPALISAARPDPLTRTTTDITRLLGQARLSAVERGAPVTFALTLSTGRYTAYAESFGARTLLEEGGLALEGVRLGGAGDRFRVRFDPLGPAETDSVNVLAATGRRVVRVDPWTGEVTADAR